MRATALVRSGRLEAAKSEYEALIAPTSSQGRDASYVRTSLGLVELQLGELAAGRRDLEAAIRLDPSNGAASGALEMVPYLESGTLTASGLGHMLTFHEAKAAGRIADADAELRALIASSPEFALGYVLQAGFLAANGREPDCDESLRPVLAKNPDDVGLRFASYHCTILRRGPQSSEGKEAVREARKLAAAHPDDAVGANLLQWLEE
jgi:tetratricopeptide (TPR) repeat protein